MDISKLSNIINEEKKFKELFRVTEKFHSSMNVDIVLDEIIKTLRRVFPHFEYTLLLSNDTNHDKNLPIKEFQFDLADDVIMESFVTGEIRIDKNFSCNQTILYAPLCGKQGVYGILQVISFSTVIFQNSEEEFIRLLAITAGSALENAKLYEQSQRLIADLQLINDTSHRLNSFSKLDETLQFLKAQILKSFCVSNIGFVLINYDEISILKESSSFFHCTAGKACIEFITDNIRKKKESLYYSNLGNLLNDESFSYASLMAVPMLEGNTLKGFCVVLHEQPYYFTFDMYKLFQSLIHHSTLAVTNSMLREELEKMVITDHLTQLFEKNFLNNQIQHSMQKDEEGTFILLDIDNFKEVNDTYGHQIGDEILIQVAKLIQQNIRTTDIGARWGGEELAIYLPGVSLNVGTQVANRLLEAVYLHTSPQITVSCGVSYWNKKRKDDFRSLFNRADTGLYHAKELGKNQVVVKEDN
ncbi:sensor domain-containing diguanylate cyclase [Heyndrickxia sp. NPDC080065]|uniref:sensor domain-containing diguanylate cyclase n=1 Tax=Heyndrickxia sp. NPDC080065 TaxID=3390568 RepID=UPI003D07D722